MPHPLKPQRFCFFTTFMVMLGIYVTFVAACSGIQPIDDPADSDESYLELEVEPETAEIYVDDDYQGTVDGWRDQVVPVEPGERRIELRAEGYITQRFDVEANEGRWVTLRARLEPDIDAPGAPESEPGEEDDDGLSAPPRPELPEPH